MAFDDPARLDLGALFRHADMFDSRRAWGAAGFHVIARDNDGKIMVARHPQVAGLLFKKYTSDLPEKDQTKNYERRLEGSNRLRGFADSRRFSRIVVPHKWLLKLPHPFSRRETSHVLVVEQLDLLADRQTKAAYRSIDPGLLAELCVVLHRFRGMDSIAKNLPFTADGRIGLIDTEHWDRSTSKPYLYRVGKHLSRDRNSLAKKIFGQLEDGDDVSVGDFRVGDFDDEEDTSGSASSDDDFSREEDTSASSS